MKRFKMALLNLEKSDYASIPEITSNNDSVFEPRARPPFAKAFLVAFVAVASAIAGMFLERYRKVQMVQHDIIETLEANEQLNWNFFEMIPFLGKHKEQKIEKQSNVYGKKFCNNRNYSKRTLKTAYDMPFAALFEDTRGQKKFEASDVIQVGDYIYSICDNSWAISRFHKTLTPFHPDNIQIGNPNRDPLEDSGYEAIFHNDDTFYVIRESVPHESFHDDDDDTNEASAKTCYHAVVEEIVLTENNDYTVTQQCSCQYEFEGTSKGFEGAVGVKDINDDLVILGLCEGNHCSEERKLERGNGKVIAMKKIEQNSTNSTCLWGTVKEIAIPPSANFLDYSAISMTADGRVAITSQEDSVVWIGQLLGLDETGRLDLESASFDLLQGEVYSFGRSDICTTKYCNVEGIHFLNDEMLIAVSDKMKSKGKQDFRCMEMDQSVHVFVMP